MDVEALLQGVIRFSNFITSRLVVAGLVFYVLAGFLKIGNQVEGFLPDVRLVNEVAQNYETIFETLGVSEFGLLLVLFVFLTTIHLVYVLFESIGRYLPPAIVPVSGWRAIDGVTLKAFEILREARGEEHTEEENQRLYEFRKKLREIDQTSKEKYRERLESTYSTFRIAKTFVLFSLAAWLYALASGGYDGRMGILLLLLALSLMLACAAALSILRSHYARVTGLYRDVVDEIIEFSKLWVAPDYQRRLVELCTAEPRLRHVSLEVVVPVFGTLDALRTDLRRMRRRSLRSG